MSSTNISYHIMRTILMKSYLCVLCTNFILIYRNEYCSHAFLTITLTAHQLLLCPGTSPNLFVLLFWILYFLYYNSLPVFTDFKLMILRNQFFVHIYHMLLEDLLKPVGRAEGSALRHD